MNPQRILRHAKQHIAAKISERYGSQWGINYYDPDCAAYALLSCLLSAVEAENDLEETLSIIRHVQDTHE